MKVTFLWRSRSLLVSTTLAVILTLILAACGGATPTTQGSTPGRGTGGNTNPTASPGIGLGPQPCPEVVKAPTYWDPIIPTQNGVTRVENVTCGNLAGNPTLQALVTVRYGGTGAVLDVYVYTDITSPHPFQLFKLQNLYKGDAKISRYNTVLTAEVDQNSSINAGKDNASLVQDLFREFKWSDSTGTLVPVSFPGIYPDLTRFQAENDQAQVNQGQIPWKLDAMMVANHMASDPHLLNWPSSSPATLVSGGGPADTDALVTVKNPAAGGGTMKVSLQRLEGNTNGGIWEVVAVTSDGTSITAPQSRDRLTSPVRLTGIGNSFAGALSTVAVLDHLYMNIGTAKGVIGNGSTTFSASVTYNSTFKGGSQEGIVVLYIMNNAGNSPAAVVMMKELLS